MLSAINLLTDSCPLLETSVRGLKLEPFELIVALPVEPLTTNLQDCNQNSSTYLLFPSAKLFVI